MNSKSGDMSEERTKKSPEKEEEATVTEEASAEEKKETGKASAGTDGADAPEMAESIEEENGAEGQAEPAEEATEEESGAEESAEPAEEAAGEEQEAEEPAEEATGEEQGAEESVDEPDAGDADGIEERALEEADEAGEEGPDEAEQIEEPVSEGQEEPAMEKPKGGETSAERAAAEAEQEKAGRMRWYVVHTYSGRENKVKDTIERMIRNSEMQDQFGKVLVATEEVAEMKKGKKKVSQRKLFPSYILIEMEMSDEAWGMIENVPGVTHFVGEGKKPFPIPKKEVDRILGRMVKKEGVVPEVPYTLGEHVKVVDGPFTDFSGIVDEINPERGKLKVLVSIFGRETPVELDFLQVKSL
jgi:transcriptional antiterminator NusG